MRLTKVQKFLKENGIDYEYNEVRGCGGIVIPGLKGKTYTIDEYTANKGCTPIGIFTNLGGRNDVSSQRGIVRLLEQIVTNKEE